MEQGRTIGEVAERFGVHRKTVRRVATRLGVTGQLVQRRYGSIRVFGEEEVERLHAYFRTSVPEEVGQGGDTGGADEEEPRDTGGTLALPSSLEAVRPLVEEVLRPLLEATQRQAEEVRQLREVLAARLPAPSTPAPQPRVRWRACTEVALLGVVTVLAGAMVAAVARVLQVNGALVLPW